MTSQALRRGERGAPLETYLREINETPLLSADEERVLAGRVALGDLEARDHLARANLRLVVNAARAYQGRGLEMEDLIAEGNLGLMRAVEGFDPTVGTRFSTYAAYWIKQSLRSALMRYGRFVRLPAYAYVLLGKWRRAEAALAERLGREPTADEVGKALRLTARRRERALEALRAACLTPRGESSEGDDPESGTAIDRGKAPEQRADERELWEMLQARLDRLDAREATVVRLRFGLGPEGPLSLQEIGDRLGLTKERIRQLEAAALSSMAEGN